MLRSVLAISAALLVLGSTPASAAPGDLDHSFGAGGKVTLSLARDGSQGNAIAVQPDGRILIGGWAYGKGFAVVRLLRDGSLDPSFGDDGVVTTNFPTGPAVVTDLALGARGRIVAAGFSEAWVAIARYRPDGSLDPTFGRDGIVLARYRNSPTGAEGLALEPDGGVIVVGTAADRRWVVARFSAAGRPVRRFGAGGWATVNFGSGEEGARDVALTTNGRIVVAGAGAQHLALARFRPDGTLDPQFGGGDGTVVAGGPVRSTASALALLPGGGLFTAGHAGSTFQVRRFLPSGRPDRAYGTGGTASGPAIQGLAFDVAAEGGGAAIVVGSQYEDFTVARYLRDGSLDPSFGDHGVVHTRFPNYGPAESAALMPNGRVVVVGQSGERIGVARYED